MIKFEQLNLANIDLTEEEKAAPAHAEVAIKGATLKGTCHFKRDGMNLVAAVQTGGAAAEQTDVTLDDIKLTLKKTITREYEVEASQATVDTKLGDAVVSAKQAGNSVTVSDGVVTLDPTPAEAGTIALDLELNLGEAAATDPNLNAAHKLKLDAGPVHVSAICMVEKAPGTKPSKTRCSIRGRKPWITVGEDAPLHLQ